MKSNQFELLKILELPSSINRDREMFKDESAKYSWSYLIVFQHQIGNKAVALHVSLRYQTQTRKLLLQEGATLIAKITGWDEMSKEDKRLRGDERILSFIDYGLAFVSGMLYRHVSGSVLDGVVAPHIAAYEIIDNVFIEEKPKKSE